MAKQPSKNKSKMGPAAKRRAKKTTLSYTSTKTNTKLKKKRDSKPVHAAGNIILQAADATRLTHVPPHIPLGPYTVLRGRTIVPVTTSITGQNTVLMLGSYGLAGQYNSAVTPVVAVLGAGTNVPGITESILVDTVASAYDTTGPANATANASLHALTIEVNCVSTATSAAGIVYYGAVNQRVNRQNFATYNALAQSVMTRREMSAKSAYCAMTAPIKLSSYPVDIVDWASQKPLVEPSLTLGQNFTNDALAQMILVWPNTTTAVEYVVTIHTEWRVNFTDPGLASTAIKHEPASTALWDSVMNAGSQLGGKIHEAEGMLASVGSGVASAYNAYQFATNIMGQIGAVTKVV
jgi:hypothetical protein